MVNIGSLLAEAASLMVVGMVGVYLFLTSLIYVTKYISTLVPQETPPSLQPASLKKKNVTSSQNSTSPELVAAISAAVHQYRASSK